MAIGKIAKYTFVVGVTALSFNALASSSSSIDKMASNKSPLHTTKKQQAQESQAVAVGLGSGVVIGAVVAGPVGAVVAGVMGALLGENSAQDKSLKAVNTQLSRVQQDNAELLAVNQTMQNQMMLTQVAYEDERMHAPAPTLKSSIQFKSGSVVVESLYAEQLDLVAKALKGNEKLTVRLTGQADKRGDSQFNQALSMQRALSVKAYLTDLGVQSEQIMTVAVGESQSAHTEHEGIFFDRKVEMEIAERAPVLMSRNN